MDAPTRTDESRPTGAAEGVRYRSRAAISVAPSTAKIDPYALDRIKERVLELQREAVEAPQR